MDILITIIASRSPAATITKKRVRKLKFCSTCHYPPVDAYRLVHLAASHLKCANNRGVMKLIDYRKWQ